MTTFKGMVGNGKMNDPAHVAVLQMCLKVLKYQGRSYYAGDIDGVYNDALTDAFRDLHHDGNFSLGHITQLELILPEYTAKLLKRLPAPYRGLEYHLTPPPRPKACRHHTEWEWNHILS